jgi:methionyl aminopeptidase
VWKKIFLSPRPADSQMQAVQALGEVFTAVERLLRPGTTTLQIDDVVARELKARGATPYFLGWQGFPKSCSTSINDEVINTTPSTRCLQAGDLLKLQIGARVREQHALQCWTYAIGALSEADARLLAVAFEALRAGIQQVRAGARVGDVSSAIQEHIEAAGMAASRHFVGHGIGAAPHQHPPLPCYGRRGFGARLQAGQVLSIFALAHLGSFDVQVAADGWNAIAVDGAHSAFFSRMVRVGDGGSELLMDERTPPPS